MNHWLMKSEPDVFSWDDLVRKGKAEWDGVRNHLAQSHMKAMRKGDRALFYHSKHRSRSRRRDGDRRGSRAGQYR
jgi:predicted RNA-binding protein with PUA-like domain